MYSIFSICPETGITNDIFNSLGGVSIAKMHSLIQYTIPKSVNINNIKADIICAIFITSIYFMAIIPFGDKL